MKALKRASLLMLALFVLLSGCKATTTGSTGPDTVFLAEEYPTLKLGSLAFLGMAAVVNDPDACGIAEPLLRSYLTGGQQKLLIVDESVAQQRAAKEGLARDLSSVMTAWKNSHMVDLLKLKTLGQSLGFDGFVFADLTTWREEQIDWTDEGNSFTEVAIILEIYEAHSGLLAWRGEKMVRSESLHYRHGSGTGTGVYQQGTAERTERAEKIAPPPPPAAEVAEEVVQNLILGLPERPNGK